MIPRKVDADQRHVPKVWKGVAEDSDRGSIRSNVKVLDLTKVLKMIQLESLEIGCWVRATKIFTSDQLASVVADL